MPTTNNAKGRQGSLAFAALFALLPQVALADFASDFKRAEAWDHVAQRNVAYAYQTGEGTSQNAVEACAWRSVVVFARGAEVDDSDIINLEGCQEKGLLAEATKRALSIVKKLQPRAPRNVDLDLRGLAADHCDGSQCSDQFQRFADIYKAAIRGETKAMRALAECFQTTDCSPAGFNGFQGCLWTLETIRVAGDRDPQLRSWRATLCEGRPAAAMATEHHLTSIREMRAGR